MDIAPFQADPSIADVAIWGDCEAILSGDSDFSMYVGPGGPDHIRDIMIRDIKISQKTFHNHKRNTRHGAESGCKED